MASSLGTVLVLINDLTCMFNRRSPRSHMTTADMSKITGVTDCLLPELLNSWQIILRSQNKSPATITSYKRAVRLYLEWCERNGHAKEITRAQVQA
jgi:hypothetical protein